MLRKLAPIALCAASFSVASDSTPISAKHLFATSQAYKVAHGRNGFTVNGRAVSPVDVSADLRNVTSGNLIKQLSQNGTRLQVTRRGNDFEITKQQTLNGGGVIGSWLGGWIGYGSVMTTQKLVVAGIGYGVGLICPPAGVAAGIVADVVLSVVAQPIAVTAAVGGAIAGGVITGPV